MPDGTVPAYGRIAPIDDGTLPRRPPIELWDGPGTLTTPGDPGRPARWQVHPIATGGVDGRRVGRSPVVCFLAVRPRRGRADGEGWARHVARAGVAAPPLQEAHRALPVVRAPHRAHAPEVPLLRDVARV